MNKPIGFRCPQCGLHYEDQQMARMCEEFCRKHNACNMDIAKHSLESQSGKANNEG